MSSFENIEEVTDTILSANEDSFSFKPVNLTEVILAISHFSSQAKGVDGVPQSVVVKALLIIGTIISQISLTPLSLRESFRALGSRHR